MVTIEKTWTEIKALYNTRKIPFQFDEYDEEYAIRGDDGDDKYICEIIRDTGADVTEFEAGYKALFNKSITERTSDGRQTIMTTSRPMNATTCFPSVGDDFELGIIGEGTPMTYDFENNDDLITAPSGYKRKQIDFGFIDSTWLKEGTVYFHNAIKNSYVDMYIVCPSGQYYLKNDKSVGLAMADLPIEHFAIKLPIQGTCPMGDEFNTESCSQEIPSDYMFRMEITVPESDTNSNGYMNLEIYRERTVVLE